MLVPLLLLGLATSQSVWQLADQDVVQDFSTTPPVLVASIPCAEQVNDFTLLAWVEHETLPTNVVNLSKTPLGVQAEVLKVDGTYTSLTIEGAEAQKWEEIVLTVSSNAGKLTLCSLSWQGTPTCTTSYSGNQFPSFDTGKSSLRLGAGEVGPTTQGKITNARVITAALTDSEIGKLSAEHRCGSVSGACEGPISNADPSLTRTSSQPICLHTSLPIAPKVPLDSQSRYYETTDVAGSVLENDMNVYTVSIRYSTTTSLTFRLTILTGDADLYVMTKVNGVEYIWSSSKAGSDEIILWNTDSEFVEDQGYGLKRQYAVGVEGFSSGLSSYKLSVEATYTNQWNSDAPITAFASEDDIQPDLKLLQKGVHGLNGLLSALPITERTLDRLQFYGIVLKDTLDLYTVPAGFRFPTSITFSVTEITGDIDLYVTTIISAKEVTWYSRNLGSDLIVLWDTDTEFASDPDTGMRRDFQVGVYGFSNGWSQYKLEIETSYIWQSNADAPISAFEKDTGKMLSAQLTQSGVQGMDGLRTTLNGKGQSYSWIFGAVALVGLGVWAYLKKEALFRKKGLEGGYLLVHSA